jgi:hypothetical protein
VLASCSSGPRKAQWPAVIQVERAMHQCSVLTACEQLPELRGAAILYVRRPEGAAVVATACTLVLAHVDLHAIFHSDIHSLRTAPDADAQTETAYTLHA